MYVCMYVYNKSLKITLIYLHKQRDKVKVVLKIAGPKNFVKLLIQHQATDLVNL